MRRAALLLALACAVGASACEPTPVPPVTPPPPTSATPAASAEPAAESGSEAAPPVELNAVPRLAFNRIAAELDLPFFWIADADKDGALDAPELAILWRVGERGGPWVIEGEHFTKAFVSAYGRIAKVHAEGHPAAGLAEAEKKRRAAVLLELSQGRPSLVRTDLRGASDEDRALVEHVLEAARLVERLYEKQLGSFGQNAAIPADDPASRALFWRNHGPSCQAPKTENDPECSAVAPKPPRVSGLYPPSVQTGKKWCEALEKRPDEKAILGPFTVVTQKGADLAAVPYSEFYKEEMTAISKELHEAADAVTSAGEAPLKAYLAAASKAFLSNDWEPADEAWAKMSVHNSKWYLRVGPDETYADPCSRKAGFHVSFARINQDSLAWQKKLDPVKNDMEGALAKAAGAPYKARSVSFHLPDFIDVVLNAGDSRSNLGATIGQSLPNWGPVANQGRGRTVAMTNFYTDADSRAARREAVGSLLCKASFDEATLDPALVVMTTVLHEAAHNLGPAHEYKVKDKKDGKEKTDAEAFGGALAGMLEELKAQTSAMYLADWLAAKKLVEPAVAKRSHVADIIWSFGHISEGMTGEGDTVKPYAQLSAIQVGAFVKAKAITFHADQMAENGKDKGCIQIHDDKLPAAIAALEKQVLAIKARGDKDAAQKLQKAFVEGDAQWKALRALITERWLRQPKSSFVYSIDM
jgi:hypothetical protein